MTRSLSSDGFTVSVASTDNAHADGPSPVANPELERRKHKYAEGSVRLSRSVPPGSSRGMETWLNFPVTDETTERSSADRESTWGDGRLSVDFVSKNPLADVRGAAVDLDTFRFGTSQESHRLPIDQVDFPQIQ